MIKMQLWWYSRKQWWKYLLIRVRSEILMLPDGEGSYLKIRKNVVAIGPLQIMFLHEILSVEQLDKMFGGADGYMQMVEREYEYMNEIIQENIKKLFDEIDRCQTLMNSLSEEINRQRGQMSILCSCGEYHKISELDLIQSHWYIPPRGCTEGDYWREGELIFVCPETGTRNIISFDNYDVPWERRGLYSFNPEQQFKNIYKSLFKSCIDENDGGANRGVNNDYVNDNRKMFGLVERSSSWNGR